jgi:hypothetical protein
MIGNLGCRFDWYELSIDGVDDGRVARALSLALGARITQGKGRNGYAVCEVVQRAESVLAEVYGHSAREGEVHVKVSGDPCDEVVPVIRRLYPAHRVSRVDSALDFASDFDSLDALALNFALERGLSHRLITDSEGGATRYLGAATSEVRVRVYKKSEQLRAVHPELGSSIVDGNIRAEFQGRPGKREVKERVSSMTADEVWGLGQWSQKFAASILGFDAPRVPSHFWKPSDWDRAMHFLEKQYGPMMARRVADVGLEVAQREVLEALFRTPDSRPF